MTETVLTLPRWADFRGVVSVLLGGEPIVEETRGLEGRPAEIRLNACSVGKQFVAASAMLLVEAGDLDLHAPVGRYLGSIPEAWHRITTHQLLAHTSGLGHWDQVPGFDPNDLPTVDEAIARRAGRPLISEPGATFRYSSLGYAIAARVVEGVSGIAYPDFAAARILAPLGMSATTVDPMAIAGTNDVVTTVADLGRYARAFAAGEVLGAESSELMCAAHTAVGPEDTEFDGTTGYGYGCYVGTFAGRPMHCHGGDIPGYRSAYVAVPSLDASIAVLSDGDHNDAVGLAASLLARIAPTRRRWELWREDDNANRYLVSVHDDENSARARLAEFESGVVHKQSYWVTAV